MGPLTVDQVADRHGVRPLTARSAVASTLLGVDPPRLPTGHLVQAGRLFGIAEGTTRVALSRMVAAGELSAEGGSYRLLGRLLERHTRQDQSRTPPLKEWAGAWMMAVVASGRRDAETRADLRRAAGALRLAELREGVWMRPDNLDEQRLPEAMVVLTAQCDLFSVATESGPAELSARLWDLPAWVAEAVALTEDMGPVIDRLDNQETGALGPAFLLGAGVLRHLLADPLLPGAFLPAHWPGDDLRTLYDRYLAVYQTLWSSVFAR